MHSCTDLEADANVSPRYLESQERGLYQTPKGKHRKGSTARGVQGSLSIFPGSDPEQASLCYRILAQGGPIRRSLFLGELPGFLLPTLQRPTQQHPHRKRHCRLLAVRMRQVQDSHEAAGKLLASWTPMRSSIFRCAAPIKGSSSCCHKSPSRKGCHKAVRSSVAFFLRSSIRFLPLARMHSSQALAFGRSCFFPSFWRTAWSAALSDLLSGTSKVSEKLTHPLPTISR